MLINLCYYLPRTMVLKIYPDRIRRVRIQERKSFTQKWPPKNPFEGKARLRKDRQKVVEDEAQKKTNYTNQNRKPKTCNSSHEEKG